MRILQEEEEEGGEGKINYSNEDRKAEQQRSLFLNITL